MSIQPSLVTRESLVGFECLYPGGVFAQYQLYFITLFWPPNIVFFFFLECCYTIDEDQPHDCYDVNDMYHCSRGKKKKEKHVRS